MARRTTQAARRESEQNRKALRNIMLAVGVLVAIGVIYFQAVIANKDLDQITLCPNTPSSLTVLLVDVTDPMNLPQRQDFLNQLDRLRASIPQYGKLVVMKVDPISDRLLSPIITRCNPGTATDFNEVSGNPAGAQKIWEEKYRAPLDEAFKSMLEASSARRSPIMESIQSIALTELQTLQSSSLPRRLVVASDLLQNTDTINFYAQIPVPDNFLRSDAFRRVRTDLRGVEVELWMLQRGDSLKTQPRALPDLWDRVIDSQGGTLSRVYTVSG